MLKKENFKKDSVRIIDWMDKYFQNLESFPVKSQVAPKDIYNQIPPEAPQEEEPMDKILKDLDDIILPGITHWQHPNFHAYFTANASLESLFAEMITSSIAAQCMIWETSPAAAELEERMMEWLMKAMGFPPGFEGTIQDTASTATLTAIITAREVATDFKSNEEGVPNNLRVYCSTQTHSSIDKAVGISGIGKKNLVKIPVDEKMSMIPELLEQQIEEDIKNGFKPCCVVAAVGTTGTVAVDPVKPVAKICKKYGIWLHIDAAFAGTALLLPEYRWMVEGVEDADSFVFNPHKWMFTHFDCSVYFVKDVDVLIKTFEVLPEYLKTGTRGLVNDYRDWGIPLGRRFRALKLWFVIRGYGLLGLRKRLREHIELNDFFAQAIAGHPDFELVLDPFLNFTCFRYKTDGKEVAELNELNEQLKNKLNKTGKLFLSHTKIKDKYVLRFVIGQTYVEKRHVEHALTVIFEEVETL